MCRAAIEQGRKVYKRGEKRKEMKGQDEREGGGGGGTGRRRLG